MNSFLKSLALSLIFCTQQFGAAQNTTIDSLKLVLKDAQNPTAKARVCYDISWEYIYLDQELALHYTEQGMAIAKQAKDSAQIATGYGMLGICHDISGNYFKSAEAYQNAISILEKIPNSEADLAINYNNLAVLFKFIKDYKKAILYQKMPSFPAIWSEDQ